MKTFVKTIIAFLLFALIGENSAIKADNTAVAAVLNERLFSIYDYAPPQYSMELWRRYGYEGTNYLQMLRSLRREEAVANDTFFAFENNRVADTLMVRFDVADAGIGNDTVFELDPSKIDALGNFYARENFDVTIPITEVQATIVDIDATNYLITLRPVSATSTIGALTAGQELSITNGGWAAGTAGADPATKGAVRRDFWTQIFKEGIGTEGTQLANATFFKVYSTGETADGWWSPQTMDMEWRMGYIEDGAYLLGQEATNPNLVTTTRRNNVNVNRHTKGQIPWTRELGYTLPYVPGSIDIEDFDQVGLYLRSQTLESKYTMFSMGARLYNDIENTLVDFVGSYSHGTDLTQMSTALFAGNQDLALNIGFSQAKKGGIEYLFKSMDNFSNPVTFGAEGYDFDKYGMIMPVNKTKDAKTGIKMPNFTSMYRAYGSNNRRYKMYNLVGGGNPGGVSVDSVDEVAVHVTAHHGLRALGMNAAILFDPS